LSITNFAHTRLGKVILSVRLRASTELSRGPHAEGLSKEDFCDLRGRNRLKSPFDGAQDDFKLVAKLFLDNHLEEWSGLPNPAGSGDSGRAIQDIRAVVLAGRRPRLEFGKVAVTGSVDPLFGQGRTSAEIVGDVHDLVQEVAGVAGAQVPVGADIVFLHQVHKGFG